ncbi:MAG: hypothetical protein OXH76_18380 [Boseongicola sp.]|nr:hypothetical protein [Boseongicola sp.]
MMCAARAGTDSVMPAGRNGCAVEATCDTERSGRIVVPDARSAMPVRPGERNEIAL